MSVRIASVDRPTRPVKAPSSPIYRLDLRRSQTAPYRTTEAEEPDRTLRSDHHGVGLKRSSSVDRPELDYLVFTAESSPEKAPFAEEPSGLTGAHSSRSHYLTP